MRRVDSTAPIMPTNINRSKAVAVAVAAVAINIIEVGIHVSKAAGHSKVTIFRIRAANQQIKIGSNNQQHFQCRK